MAEKPEKPAGVVQSVRRAFEILELITAAGEGVSLSDLAESATLPLPTIHRLLQTLGALGYVRQLPNRRYGLGPRLIKIGEVASRQLGAWARPHLATLVDKLGETANMAILDGDMATYVAQAPSAHSMRMFIEVGRRVHTHSTGVGKAILAQLDDGQVHGILARAGMPTSTVNSISDPDRLIEELQRIRTRGYATDDNEQELGVRCFAVAVPNMPSPSAISVSGPITRVDVGFAERAVPLLKQAACDISADVDAMHRQL